jgi:hypothetical protein
MHFLSELHTFAGRLFLCRAVGVGRRRWRRRRRSGSLDIRAFLFGRGRWHRSRRSSAPARTTALTPAPSRRGRRLLVSVRLVQTLSLTLLVRGRCIAALEASAPSTGTKTPAAIVTAHRPAPHHWPLTPRTEVSIRIASSHPAGTRALIGGAAPWSASHHRPSLSVPAPGTEVFAPGAAARPVPSTSAERTNTGPAVWARSPVISHRSAPHHPALPALAAWPRASALKTTTSPAASTKARPRTSVRIKPASPAATHSLAVKSRTVPIRTVRPSAGGVLPDVGIWPAASSPASHPRALPISIVLRPGSHPRPEPPACPATTAAPAGKRLPGRQHRNYCNNRHFQSCRFHFRSLSLSLPFASRIVSAPQRGSSTRTVAPIAKRLH